GFGGGGAKLGIGGMLILAVLSMVFGKDLVTGSGGDVGPTVGVAPGPDGGTSAGRLEDPSEETMVQFVSFVLDSAQATWRRQLPEYRDAKLVLFRNAVSSACGFAEAASGPFYCPGDQRVYVDLAFFDQLDRQFGAPGDF